MTKKDIKLWHVLGINIIVYYVIYLELTNKTVMLIAEIVGVALVITCIMITFIALIVTADSWLLPPIIRLVNKIPPKYISAQQEHLYVIRKRYRLFRYKDMSYSKMVQSSRGDIGPIQARLDFEYIEQANRELEKLRGGRRPIISRSYCDGALLTEERKPPGMFRLV